MRENKFRVWCEFEFEGEIIKKMEGPESWFLISQAGKLWTYEPDSVPQPLDKAYKVAIPLFYTGLKDKNGKEIYEEDIDSRGRIVEYLVNMSGYYLMKNGEGFHLCHDQNVLNGCIKHIEIIGNKRENPEILEAKK